MGIVDRLEKRRSHLTRRLRQSTDPDQMRAKTARSLGEYLNVDRTSLSGVDWGKRLVTVDRD